MRHTRTDVILAGQEERLRDTVTALLAQPAFMYDVETSGEHRGVPHLNKVTWISLASRGVTAVVAMGHPIGTRQVAERREPRLCKDGKTRNYRRPVYEDPPPQMSRATVFELLAPLFLDERIIKVAHNQPFDAPSIAKYLGELPRPPYDDTWPREWLIDENLRGQFGLKDIARRRFGLIWDTEDIGKRVEDHPFATVAHYSWMDAHVGWLIYQAQEADLAREYPSDPRPLRLERLQQGALFRMRLNGAPVDVARLTAMETELSARLVTEEAAVYRIAGREFNLSSPRQRQDVLYLPKPEGQGLRPWKLTTTGKQRKDAGDPEDVRWFSADDEVLASYPKNPLAAAMRQHGDTQKLLSTYVRGWLGTEGHETRVFNGRIHTAFKQAGTFTGRYSSASPNLQNIPKPSTPDGRLIRGVICAPPGWLLAVADYSQIELVILAHFIGHGKLYEAALAGIDLHTATAAGVAGKDPDDVTGDERQKFGKSMNFATVYGAQIAKLAQMMETTQQQARVFKARHEEEFPEIYAYQRHVWDTARSREPPYVTTLLGRKRRIRALNATEEWQRAAAERQAFNSEIQGSAADLMKLAIYRADQMLLDQAPGAYLSLTVHDELVAVTPEDQAQKVRDILTEAMTGSEIQRLIRVPLSVDAKICERWADAK
jgi:DNA polymerase I-like protein with 3'-5' exonuclease and polymerase domains